METTILKKDLYLEYWILKAQKWKSNLIIKWAEDINRHFAEENTLMENKHTKRCSESSIRKIQMKTTMRYHYIRTRMALKKKKTMPNAGENEEKLDYSYIAGGSFL